MNGNCSKNLFYGTSLDVIRFIAMTGIVVDHHLQATGKSILIGTGLWLGGVFLMVFFALSAYLFGMKWAKGKYEKFVFGKFIKKRCLRIYIPLWSTLPIVIIVEYLMRNAVDIKTVLFNVVGLGWIRPFGVAGHLWFITLMMFLYLMFIIFSRFRLDKFSLIFWLIGYMVLGAIYILGEQHFSTFSSVAPVVTSFLASALFFKGNELIVLCRKRLRFLLTVTFVALILSWWMYVQGWHYTHKAVATFFSFSAGFIFFMCLLTLLKSEKNSRIVNHFAKISYEVYLVHLPLLPLTPVALRWCGLDNRALVIIVWILLSWFFAVCVNKVSQRFMSKIN